MASKDYQKDGRHCDKQSADSAHTLMKTSGSPDTFYIQALIGGVGL